MCAHVQVEYPRLFSGLPVMLVIVACVGYIFVVHTDIGKKFMPLYT